MACRSLLQRMAPEHKFATAAKLCGEVLGGVADGLLPLQECEEVLGDALRCLASKDIKVRLMSLIDWLHLCRSQARSTSVVPHPLEAEVLRLCA